MEACPHCSEAQLIAEPSGAAVALSCSHGRNSMAGLLPSTLVVRVWYPSPARRPLAARVASSRRFAGKPS
jgi:hypothetical protein